jgi:hypothetical protein
VEFVSFYNLHSDFLGRVDTGKWLKPGMILIIKEPQVMLAGDNSTTFIRVDSPSGCYYILRKN